MLSDGLGPPMVGMLSDHLIVGGAGEISPWYALATSLLIAPRGLCFLRAGEQVVGHDA